MICLSFYLGSRFVLKLLRSPGSRIGRQVVSATVVDQKISSKHRPVLHRLSDMQVHGGYPRDKVFQDGQRNVTLEGPDPAQSATLSPPYLGPSLVTVQLFKGVFFKPEDFETRFGSPNQPQQVTQEQTNCTSPPPITNSQIVSTSSQSVTPLSLSSTSTYHQQDVISNYESQPQANGPTSKRKICEIENDVDDDDDSVQWLDDGQENKESSPSVMKSRFDTKRPENAQPKVVKQSQKQPAENEQQKNANKQDGHVITLSLKCPEWNCSHMFTTDQQTTAVDQLNHHLKVVHSIGLSRCMVMDCAESFPNRHLLGKHLKHFHAGTVEWHCSKCAKHYASYQLLFQHTVRKHQLGIFQCSFAECSFTGEHKTNVFSHYALEHTNKPELECQAKSGCAYRTTKPSLLQDHERVHLSVKPFRCDWPNCHYSCASRSNTILHIKRVHLKSKTNSSDEVELVGKPADYLSVDRSLLLKHRLFLRTFKQ